MANDDTMIDLMKEIKQAVTEGNVKRQKIPFKAKIGRLKARKGWASVLYVMNNKSVDFIKAPIEDNTIKVGNLIHEATPDDILIFRGRPMLIIPEWREKPIRPFDDKLHEVDHPIYDQQLHGYSL